MIEEWRDVPGYELYFKVSNTGKVFSKRTNKELSVSIGKTGYKILSTRLDGRKSKAIALKVHRLVALAFIDNEYNKPYVNHKDGVKTNNTVGNLEWCTAKENSIHAVKTGLTIMPSGENHPSTILNVEIVKRVRELYESGLYSYANIATMLNLKKRTVAGIVRRETWKDI